MRLTNALNNAQIGPLTTNAGFLYRLSSDANFGAGIVDTGMIERRGDALTNRLPPNHDLLCQAASCILGAGTGPFNNLSGLRINAPPVKEITLVDHYGVRHSLSLPVPSDTENAVPTIKQEITVYQGGERFRLSLPRAEATEANAAAQGAILAPMPGRIIAVDVAVGQKVKMGERLVTLEAMKMEHSLIAPFDGTVTELAAENAAQVNEATLLIKIEKDE